MSGLTPSFTRFTIESGPKISNCFGVITQPMAAGKPSCLTKIQNKISLSAFCDLENAQKMVLIGKSCWVDAALYENWWVR